MGGRHASRASRREFNARSRQALLEKWRDVYRISLVSLWRRTMRRHGPMHAALRRLGYFIIAQRDAIAADDFMPRRNAIFDVTY